MCNAVRWIYGRCTGVKGVTEMFTINCACRKCDVNTGEAVEQEER